MKTFYHALANSIIASITNFTVWFAITFFIYLETRSVFATSIISGFYLALTALSGIWFGSIVDHNKKKLVMLASSAISLLSYIICFAIYISASASAFKNPANPILWIFVALLIIGVTVGNLRNIVIPTLVTILIPEDRRDRANGLAGTAAGVSFLVTSVISGLLVGLAGMYYVLILGMAMTALAIIHLWHIEIPEKKIVHTTGKSNKVDVKGTIKVISQVPGLITLVVFTTFNNFLGGVFMALMDAYGLSLVSVEVWGLLWGFLSTGFIIGGLVIAKWGLGKNPLKSLFTANIIIWTICIFFTIQSTIILLTVGMFIYLCVVPYIEASEQTIIQKVVPAERQGRVFGFAQSMEQAASPLTAFLIGPIAQFVFIPFMTTGKGVEFIGGWFGTGPDRGMALVFTLTGIIGLVVTLLSLRSKYYRQLSRSYLNK